MTRYCPNCLEVTTRGNPMTKWGVCKACGDDQRRWGRNAGPQPAQEGAA